MSMRRLSGLVLLLASFSLCATNKVAWAKEKVLVWREIDDAMLRVNDAPVKEWGVFQTGKKRDPLLVQMGNRYLLIRIHERQIFEVDPATVQKKSDDLLWDSNNHPAQPLTVSEWDATDTEAVFRIRAKITGEGRLLDIELPHQLDLSGMSPHAANSSRHR